jgi:hypothetical protein
MNKNQTFSKNQDQITNFPERLLRFTNAAKANLGVFPSPDDQERVRNELSLTALFFCALT